NLPPAGVELRPHPVHHERASVARPAAQAGGAGAALVAPLTGPWTRLMAAGAVAGTGLAVVSGAAGWGTAHRLLAALALPWLVGLLVVAWVSARRLLAPAVAAVVAFGLAALLTERVVHLTAAAVAFGVTVLLARRVMAGKFAIC